MWPPLDEVQQAISRATSYILEVSRGIAQWGQQRYRDPTPEEHEKMMEHGEHLQALAKKNGQRYKQS